MAAAKAGVRNPPQRWFAVAARPGRKGRREARAPATLWLDVEELPALHASIAKQTTIEWGPEVYSYGRREFGFRDPDGNWVILSEVTSDPPTCVND
jgi:uncharacterized glyoxalase superfamily protein PhnB